MFIQELAGGKETSVLHSALSWTVVSWYFWCLNSRSFMLLSTLVNSPRLWTSAWRPCVEHGQDLPRMFLNSTSEWTVLLPMKVEAIFRPRTGCHTSSLWYCWESILTSNCCFCFGCWLPRDAVWEAKLGMKDCRHGKGYMFTTSLHQVGVEL